MTVSEPISVVVPVYNEVGGIENVVRSLHDKVLSKVPGSELIVAEDGSADGTKEVLSRLQAELGFTLISGPARKGYTRAVKDALLLPKRDIIFFSDSDGQHDPEDFFKLYPHIGDNDIVIGRKCPRRDPLHRRILSYGYNKAIGLLFGLWLRDIDSGFRLLRRSVVEEILPQTRTLKHCVSSEYVIRAFMAGYRICEAPVTHIARPHGTTAIFHPADLPKICFGLLLGLLKIKMERGLRVTTHHG